jgi:GNAT superfamily N-acetyltransferase
VNELEQLEAKAYGAMTESVDVRGGTCLLSDVPTLVLNRVVAVDETLDLDAVAEVYDRPYMVGVPPWVPRLALELEHRGYRPAEAWMKLTRDASPAAETTTSVRVQETLDATVFAPTVADGYGAADYAHAFAFLGGPMIGFVAWDADEPIGGASLYVDGEHAWFGVASTRPAFRGRGAQSALLAARIEAARAHGARTLSVETGAPGDQPGQSYRNIVRAGFADEYVRPHWRSPK